VQNPALRGIEPQRKKQAQIGIPAQLSLALLAVFHNNDDIRFNIGTLC
jgi:hypothetical protein